MGYSLQPWPYQSPAVFPKLTSAFENRRDRIPEALGSSADSDTGTVFHSQK